jgi:predicted phosphodiesterase
MKIVFLADIHGNSNALEAVLKDIEARNVDKVFVLGDICYRGTEPRCSLK